MQPHLIPCAIYFGQYISIGTYWIAFYVNGNKVTYFDSFKDRYIQKEIRKFIAKKHHDKHL